MKFELEMEDFAAKLADGEGAGWLDAHEKRWRGDASRGSSSHRCLLSLKGHAELQPGMAEAVACFKRWCLPSLRKVDEKKEMAWRGLGEGAESTFRRY